MSSINPRSGLYYVIPSQVFDDPDLEWPEVAFYTLLSGLAERDGYCFASNKYLAERMRKGTEQIERYLKKLEDLGYIQRESQKIGMLWDRKIFINHGFKKSLRSLTDEASKPHTGGLETSPMPPIVSEVLVSKDICVKEKQEKEMVRMENVSTTESEHNMLVKEHGLEMTEKFYTRLSLWKKDTPQNKWKKNDYRSILRWVIKAEKENTAWNSSKKPNYQTGSTNSKPVSLASASQVRPLPPQGLIMKTLYGSANGQKTNPECS